MIARSEASFQHRLDWTWGRFPYAAGESCLHKSHTTTTHGIYELLEPLLWPGPHAPVVHCLVRDVGDLGLAAFWATVGAVAASRLLAVPSLLRATLDADPGDWLPGASLRHLVLMGEAPPRDVCARAATRLPALESFHSVYGSTEASTRGRTRVRHLLANFKGP